MTRVNVGVDPSELNTKMLVVNKLILEKQNKSIDNSIIDI